MCAGEYALSWQYEPYDWFSGWLTNFSALHSHLTRIFIKTQTNWAMAKL